MLLSTSTAPIEDDDSYIITTTPTPTNAPVSPTHRTASRRKGSGLSYLGCALIFAFVILTILWGITCYRLVQALVRHRIEASGNPEEYFLSEEEFRAIEASQQRKAKSEQYVRESKDASNGGKCTGKSASSSSSSLSSTSSLSTHNSIHVISDEFYHEELSDSSDGHTIDSTSSNDAIVQPGRPIKLSIIMSCNERFYLGRQQLIKHASELSSMCNGRDFECDFIVTYFAQHKREFTTNANLVQSFVDLLQLIIDNSLVMSGKSLSDNNAATKPVVKLHSLTTTNTLDHFRDGIMLATSPLVLFLTPNIQFFSNNGKLPISSLGESIKKMMSEFQRNRFLAMLGPSIITPKLQQSGATVASNKATVPAQMIISAGMVRAPNQPTTATATTTTNGVNGGSMVLHRRMHGVTFNGTVTASSSTTNESIPPLVQVMAIELDGSMVRRDAIMKFGMNCHHYKKGPTTGSSGSSVVAEGKGISSKCGNSIELSLFMKSQGYDVMNIPSVVVETSNALSAAAASNSLKKLEKETVVHSDSLFA